MNPFSQIREAYTHGKRCGQHGFSPHFNPYEIRRGVFNRLLSTIWYDAWCDGITQFLNQWLTSRKRG